MSNIEQNLQKILSSRYGKDVRQSIHDSIHDCYEDGKAGATDLVARQQIANLVANEGSTDKDSELVDVRVGHDGTTYKSAGEAVRNQISKVESPLKSKYADMSYFKHGAILNTDGTINPNSKTQLYSKIFVIYPGEKIVAPEGFSIRVASYSGTIDYADDTAQYFNYITDWMSEFVYDNSEDIYIHKRIGIYKKSGTEISLDALNGLIETTISNLTALVNVSKIEEYVKDIYATLPDRTLDDTGELSIYNAFDLSEIKHGYENGNILLVSENGETKLIRLLGNKKDNWSVSFSLDAIYRTDIDTKIGITVSDGENILSLEQHGSSEDQYKKYLYMTAKYNEEVLTDVHLLTAPITITYIDKELRLDMGDITDSFVFKNFGIADFKIFVFSNSSTENIYFIKDFKGRLNGFDISVYNLYIRDIDFAEDDTYIYLAYYVNAIAQLSKMNKLTGSCETVALNGMRADLDSHNSIAVALDNSGNIHVAGGCHASSLEYFTGPSSNISNVQKSNALNIENATYPEFVSDGVNLYFFCRIGVSGSSYDVAYRHTNGSWERTTSAYIDDGTENNGGTCYYSPWELCSDGYFYSAFCWRNNATGVTGVGANTNVYVVKTKDFSTFYNFEGTSLILPLTINNTQNCMVEEVEQNSGLLNQVGMGVMDADGRPIVWYFKNDEYGNRNLYFASHDNEIWKQTKATNIVGKSVMEGTGTIDPLISRKNFAYRSDYGNAILFATDKLGRSYILEVDGNGQTFLDNDIKIPEYTIRSDQICVSRKHGSFVSQKTQRTLFDKYLPQAQNGNGILTIFC